MNPTAPPPVRKPKAKADIAASWDALAAALGVGARCIHRHRHAYGAPAGRSIREWREFLAARESERAARRLRPKSGSQLAREAADLRFAEARARRAEQEDAIAEAKLMTREQVLAVGAMIRDSYIAAFDQVPDEVDRLLRDLPPEQRDESAGQRERRCAPRGRRSH